MMATARAPRLKRVGAAREPPVAGRQPPRFAIIRLFRFARDRRAGG